MTAPQSTPRVAAFHTTEIREADTLRHIAPAWTQLCQRARCSPFQYPQWVLPWWRHFAEPEASLRTLTVSGQDGELLGVAPFWVRRDVDEVRRVRVVGAGNTDYVDVVAAQGHEDAVAHAVSRYLADIAADWDECHLFPLPPRSVLAGLPESSGWSMTAMPYGVFPRVELGAVPPDFIKQLDQARRALGRRGTVRVEHAAGSRTPTLLRELVALHAARWRTRGSDGVLSDDSTRSFHQEVALGMASAGLLRLHVLRVDEQPVSAFYGFARAGRLYYYIGGFDPAFAQYSVGSLAILAALEHAQAQGDADLDFLFGGERYKYRWGAVDQVGHRVSLVAARGGQASA